MSFLEIPKDVLYTMTHELSDGDLRQLCSVNRALHSLCSSEEFWKQRMKNYLTEKEQEEFQELQRESNKSIKDTYQLFRDLQILIQTTIKKYYDFDAFRNKVYTPLSLYRTKNIHIGFDEKIDKIPKEIRALERLIELYIGVGYIKNTKLDTLPKELFQLKKLNTLNIESTSITTIPSDIKHLTNLEYLFLTHNKVQTLPEEIIQLKNLKRLDIFGNPISSISPSIKDFIEKNDIIFRYKE